MESGPSRFSLSLRRPKNDGDEWYTPYKTPSNTQYNQRGIGSPPPLSPTNKGFSFFSTYSTQDGFDPGYTFSPIPAHKRTVQRPYRSPSYSSLAEYNPHPSSLPSSTSVPTGLSQPKMLFSPLHREMKRIPPPPSPPPLESPRRRTQSTPKPYTSRRWAAPTVCDMLVFPKPHITPHTITPPDSPNTTSSPDPDVHEMGQQRLHEREEWARSSQTLHRARSKSRGRSLSLGQRNNPPPDAPIIGNANVRREEAEDRERRRSTSSHPIIGRLRSSSFGIMSSRTSHDAPRSRQSSEHPSLIRRISSDRHSGRGSVSGCTSLSRSKSVVDLGLNRKSITVPSLMFSFTLSLGVLLQSSHSGNIQPHRTCTVPHSTG